MVRHKNRYLVCFVRADDVEVRAGRDDRAGVNFQASSHLPSDGRASLTGQKRKNLSVGENISRADKLSTTDNHTTKRDGRRLKFSDRDLHSALRSVIETNLGDWGWCLLVPILAIKYFDQETGLVILRTPREYYGLLWVACSLLDRLRLPSTGRWISVQIRVVHVGGTVRSCLRRTIQAFRRELPYFLDQHALKEQKVRIERALVDLTSAEHG